MPLMLSELLLAAPMDQARIGILTMAQESVVEVSADRRLHLHWVLDGSLGLKTEKAERRLVSGDFIILERNVPYVLTHGSGLGERIRFGPIVGQSVFDDLDGVAATISSTKGAVVLTAVLGIEQSAPRTAAGMFPDVMHLSGGQILLPKLLGQQGSAPEAVGHDVRILLGGAGGRAFAAVIMNLLLVHAVRSLYTQGTFDADPTVEVRRRHLGIEASLHLLHQRYAEPWTVDALAQKVAMSRSSFSAAFREATGKPPSEYLGWLRLKEAARLLADDGLAIAEIAHAVGYQSHAAFTRKFRVQHGVSPSAYRRAAEMRNNLTLPDS